MLPALFDSFRPVIMLGGFVLLLRSLGFLTLGAMVRLGRRGGALVPLWTIAALVAGYLVTPLEVVYSPVLAVEDLVAGILHSVETLEPAPPPPERLAFDVFGTVMRFVYEPPWGLWGAMAAMALLNLSIIVLRR